MLRDVWVQHLRCPHQRPPKLFRECLEASASGRAEELCEGADEEADAVWEADVAEDVGLPIFDNAHQAHVRGARVATDGEGATLEERTGFVVNAGLSLVGFIDESPDAQIRQDDMVEVVPSGNYRRTPCRAIHLEGQLEGRFRKTFVAKHFPQASVRRSDQYHVLNIVVAEDCDRIAKDGVAAEVHASHIVCHINHPVRSFLPGRLVGVCKLLASEDRRLRDVLGVYFARCPRQQGRTKGRGQEGGGNRRRCIRAGQAHLPAI
mmetsp:Transcript_80334/g.202124  ORF Transcript_80334/g.202124 Transcript_80334/m.202124 type:complete len:263 (+) Transcript_80334:239-1027(+)